ncbi:MAG: cobalamin-dependent protein [Syntrophorhabdaceae bacterium]|nr:cobalamin-dependent protein [Syntrophorhabdaceae bacterium]
MNGLEVKGELAYYLADLKEEGVLKLVKERLDKGEDPLHLMEECQHGMRLVGERYEQGVYYISGLIMAGEIMHQVGDMLLPLLKVKVSGNDKGKILLGTVEGDIHYIGKDIIKVLLRCYGFTVYDIGVDVPPEDFLEKAISLKVDIVGLSCLLNTCYTSMAKTISLIRQEMGNKGPVPGIIIGGIVDEAVCRHVGADFWATDAMTGVRLCQKMVRESKA